MAGGRVCRERSALEALGPGPTDSRTSGELSPGSVVAHADANPRVWCSTAWRAGLTRTLGAGGAAASTVGAGGVQRTVVAGVAAAIHVGLVALRKAVVAGRRADLAQAAQFGGVILVDDADCGGLDEVAARFLRLEGVADGQRDGHEREPERPGRNRFGDWRCVHARHLTGIAE
jgi:hypothetical protein